MTKIVKVTPKHCEVLVQIAKTSFLEAHGKSASKEDIDSYVSKNFNRMVFLQELENPEYIYYILYDKNQAVGYSKIILNSENTNINQQRITKLERLYLLKDFYGKNLGVELFNFNIQLSKNNKQKGMWLAVWTENQRAIHFYTKNGCKIVGSYNFKISETHSNPNHIMYLEF
jgi:ribosomal protein S18 acetylase RimI-like enzyme